jgi:hypothetical protein
MEQLGGMLGIFVLFVAMVVAAGLLLSLPVWLLWNGCLVGAVAGVAEITWLQAWGIMILCAFLFKSNVSSSK